MTNTAFTINEIGTLDTNSFVPLYIQLSERISALILEKGDAAIGRLLPSETECVEKFGVSRPTVRQAMAHLLSQGLIKREKGRGTFVAPHPFEHDITHGFEDDIKAAHMSVQYILLSWELRTPPAEVVTSLRLGEADKCWFLRRVRSVEGANVGIEERYLPDTIGRQLTRADVEFKPMLKLVHDLAGNRSSKLDVEVSCVNADREMARILGVKASTALLVRRSVLINDQETPLMYGIATFLADHYKLRFKVNYAP